MIKELCDVCKKELEDLKIRMEESEYDDSYGYNIPTSTKVFCSVKCFNEDLKNAK